MGTISSMEERLNIVIDQRIGNVMNQLVLIEEKLNIMNSRLEEEKGKVPSDIEKRGKELKDIIVRFQDDFVKGRRDRLNREGRMTKLINDHANNLRKCWKDENKDRDDNFVLLTKKINDNEQKNRKQSEEFREMVNKEL